MRAMWKGAIAFGLVTIPVKLYAATEQRDISFRQVHLADGGRIRFKRVCSLDGNEVEYADVARGYELPGGEMVVLTENDMAELPLPTAKNIAVEEFVPASVIDPIMHGKSYFVEPEAIGERAYALMRDALAASGRIGIARVALRQREALAALRVQGKVLVMDTLLWPDEVRTPDFGFLRGDVEVRPQELRMAKSLIDSMAAEFDPSQFRDGYRAALEELVSAKVEGREVTTPAAASQPAGGSLSDALRASLEALGAEKKAREPARKPAAKPSAPRKPATPRKRAAKRTAG